jgi:polyhydroxybutyrate depolymerase
VRHPAGTLRAMLQAPVGRVAIVAITVAVSVVGASCSSSASKASSTSPTTVAASSTTAGGSTTGASTTSSTAAPAKCARPHAAGRFNQTFDFQGVGRTYQLYVPRVYHGTANVPVVFDFHGYGSNALQQMLYGNFMTLAERHDFLVVAPDGQGASRHFNLTNEKGLQNDIKMALALLDHIEATFCVDTDRVYSTGMSDGAAMTSVLACVASNRFAAFGAVAVEIYFKGCGGSKPVSIVAFHGTADPIVPFNGGRSTGPGGATLGPAPAAMAGWAGHDHCDAAFVDTRLGTEVRRRTWSGCDGSSAVVFYIIDGGGHTWPGSIPIARFGLTTMQVNASDTIWAFFAAHPMAS